MYDTRVSYGTVSCGTVSYGTVSCGAVSYGTVSCGMCVVWNQKAGLTSTRPRARHTMHACAIWTRGLHTPHISPHDAHQSIRHTSAHTTHIGP
jgi:hypothetical protein